MSDWDFKPIEEKKAEDTIKENPSEAEGQGTVPAAPDAGAVPQEEKEAPDGTGGGRRADRRRKGGRRNVAAGAEGGRRRRKERMGCTSALPEQSAISLPLPARGYGPGYRRRTAAQQPGYYGAPVSAGKWISDAAVPAAGERLVCRSRGGYPPPKRKAQHRAEGVPVDYGDPDRRASDRICCLWDRHGGVLSGQEDGSVSSSPLLPFPKMGTVLLPKMREAAMCRRMMGAVRFP